MLLTAEVLQHGQNAASVAEHAQSLLRNGRRLEALLDSLLEYNKSRLGVGMAIQRRKVNLARLCREEVDLLQRALPHVKIVLDAAGDTSGHFDGSRVREALANLYRARNRSSTWWGCDRFHGGAARQLQSASSKNGTSPLSSVHVSRCMCPAGRRRKPRQHWRSG
jgi:hypothetical protein